MPHKIKFIPTPYRELEIGDCVVIIASEFGTRANQIHFGSITKINPKGVRLEETYINNNAIKSVFKATLVESEETSEINSQEGENEKQ